MNKGQSNSKKKGSSRTTSKDGVKKNFQKEGDGKKFYGVKGKTFDKKPKPVMPLSETDDIRLNRYISNSGVCSRREADIYIVSGNVKVNGEVITEMGHKVKLSDEVNFDGTILIPEKKVYVVLNKPKGFSTVNEEVLSPTNVLSLVKTASKRGLTPVGRMDKSSLGLIIFTNDTALIQQLSSPEHRSSKMYQVSLDKNLKFEDLEKIKSGLQIDDYRVFIEDIAYVEDQPKTEIGVKLKASNIKLVRALFEKLDYNVLKLDRVMYGPLTKWNLPRGKWRSLTDDEVMRLKNGLQ